MLVNCGAGSARRSSLPFAVNGNPSTTITAAGTMYSGNRSPTHRRTSLANSIAEGSLT
ncbi:hypothetical protein MMMB2_1602 [Mycobacterium marinum MB2]|nr:hypothetical protein MMMB2_1602 [Mycobacterium marinum MB2]